MWNWIILSLFLVVVIVLVLAWTLARQAVASADAAFRDVEARAARASSVFDPRELAELPEIARRYFNHAIAAGTPLSTTVRLRMEGTFLLGNKDNFQSYTMTARQVLAPPAEFVWVPVMRSGVMQISGSDALVQGKAWTKFWINGLVPVVDLQDTPDLNRSALARSAMEAIWSPASLLPSNGVSWAQTGPHSAQLLFETGIEPVELILNAEGRVLEITTMRWSDANSEKIFRLQPFGGTVTAEKTFGGFTIPAQIEVGNHYGTPDYLPFFQATITSAEYL